MLRRGHRIQSSRGDIYLSLRGLSSSTSSYAYKWNHSAPCGLDLGAGIERKDRVVHVFRDSILLCSPGLPGTSYASQDSPQLVTIIMPLH